MQKLLIFSTLAITLPALSRPLTPEDLTGIRETKAYAKVSGRAYSCYGLLQGPMSQVRDGSYFEPEELMHHYTECAERYPRTAEAQLLSTFDPYFDKKKMYEHINLLLDKGFKFSPAFALAMMAQLTADIMMPIILEKQIEGTVIPLDETYALSNCAVLEQFLKESGSHKLAEEIVPLCELKNRLLWAPLAE